MSVCSRRGVFAALVLSLLGGCEDRARVDVDVRGLLGDAVLCIDDGTGCENVPVDLPGFQPVGEPRPSGTEVALRIVDQPDQPAQRCELDVDRLIVGQSHATLTCAAIVVCDALGTPASDVRAVPVFDWPGDASIAFMELQPWPGGGYLVTTRRGALHHAVVDGDTITEVEDLLSIRARVEFGLDDGLVSAALHPRFPTVPWAFLLYVANDEPRSIRLSRFTFDGSVFDPDSEVILVEEPKLPDTNSHSGGTVRFGPDGLLYASFGDGGFVRPPSENAQDVSNALGSMVRLDVDHGDPYAIPEDNPFAAGGSRPLEGLEEIYAWGLRNPFRWSFDGDTIWLGDVGWATWEEIDTVERGGNYGWPVMEGDACVEEGCTTAPYTRPRYAYAHESTGSAVVGGFVYRGGDLPDLYGDYVFADYNRRTLVALDDPYGEARPTSLIEVDFPVITVAPDARGEILIIGLEEVVRIEAGVEGPDVPTLLSESGCMDIDDRSQLHPAFEPYDVVVPLWSDGAAKDRWIWLPPGASAEVGEAGHLSFPVGTVLAKEFRLGPRLLETRFLTRGTEGWSTVSYRWDGADASLVRAPMDEEVAEQSWHFPSPTECGHCHTGAAGVSLGPTVAQLDVGAQLDEWVARGWLETRPTSTPLAALDEVSASLETRARSYLQANCAHCHQPGTGLRVTLDLRFERTLAETGLCGPTQAEGVDADEIVVPGAPDESALILRMSSRDAGRMPPLASSVVDDDAVSVMRAWVTSLASCP